MKESKTEFLDDYLRTKNFIEKQLAHYQNELRKINDIINNLDPDKNDRR